MTFIRNFSIAFLVTLALLIPTVYFGVGYVIDNVNEALNIGDESDDTADSGDGMSDLASNATGTLSLLLIGTSPYSASDEGQSGIGDSLLEEYSFTPDTQIEFLTLVRFNCDKKQVLITALPGNLMVKLKGAEMSITDSYYYMQTGKFDLSEDYIAEVVTGCTGIPIDCYAYVDIQTFVGIADTLGGIDVDLSEPLTIGGSSIQFYPAGSNHLQSDNLLTILTYDGYTTPYSEMQVLSGVCKAVLENYCTTYGYLNIQTYWENMKKNFSSYSLGEYTSIDSFLDKIFSFKFCTVNQVNVVGSYEVLHGEKLFSIDLSSTISLLKQYS